MIETIGITGGIGSGKSVVSRALTSMSVPVYDCDSRAKALYDESQELREGMIDLLGEAIYDTPDGRINRPLLSSRIFADAALLARVNALVHPAVRRDFDHWRRGQEAEGYTLCGLESAILVGQALEQMIDRLVVVAAPLELRLKRAAARDRTTEEAIRQRMAHQLSQQELIERGDAVVYNEPHRPLLPQLWDLLEQIHSVGVKPSSA